MAFRFSLQPILRLRASVERLEQLRMLLLAAQIARVEREIISLEENLSAARQLRLSSLSEGVSAAELHFDGAREKTRADQIRALHDVLTGFRRRHDEQRRLYQAARQKREILENLRKRRFEEYRHEQLRRDQQRLDEAFLMRTGARRELPPQ
ncbi:MAG TPA: flagellar FliJ family protein [Candidatus Acidoferrales bacterium]|jgi:flagellar FliJ protein